MARYGFCAPRAKALVKKKQYAPTVPDRQGQAARMRKFTFGSNFNRGLWQKRLEHPAALPIFGEGMEYRPRRTFEGHCHGAGSLLAL